MNICCFMSSGSAGFLWSLARDDDMIIDRELYQLFAIKSLNVICQLGQSNNGRGIDEHKQETSHTKVNPGYEGRPAVCNTPALVMSLILGCFAGRFCHSSFCTETTSEHSIQLAV